MLSVAEIFRSYEILDAEGRHVNGTDKHGPNHQYGYAYEEILTGRRATAQLIMEIGITDGSSLLAWREVFPNAHCVGMDIHPAAKLMYNSHNRDRVEFCLGDQRSKEDCERAAAGRQFDFICEDATHILENTLLTLLFLWPHVKPGGLYVIEEFANVGSLRQNITELYPFADIIDTKGPSDNTESLVVLRKSK